MNSYDYLVIGAGIAGATAAAGLAAHGRLLLLERENIAGYHTTGRSAAFFAETYGNETVRQLTTASKGFFRDPPQGFSASPLTHVRGALYIARADQRSVLEGFYSEKHAVLSALERVGTDWIYAHVPRLKPGYAVAGVFDPACRDIDVNALHQGFLRLARSRGAELAMDAEVLGIERHSGLWQVTTAKGRFSARVIVNAAGAWCDEIALLAGARPLGLIPKRRTVVILPAPPELVRNDWPLVLDVEDEFYLKPESGRILASPCDATPMLPQDIQADELDVAITIERLERAFDFRVKSIERKWAGLRTFASDDTPVVGFDAKVEDFFWCAGQGGYGMQTAPAISALVEALATGKPLADSLRGERIDVNRLSPARFIP